MYSLLVGALLALANVYDPRLRAYMGRIMGPDRTDLVTPLVRRRMKERLAEGRPTTTYEMRQIIISEVWDHCKLTLAPRWLRDFEGEEEQKIGSINVRGDYATAVHPSAVKLFTPKKSRYDSGLTNRSLRKAAMRVYRRLTEAGFPTHCGPTLLKMPGEGKEKNGLGCPFWSRKEEDRVDAFAKAVELRRELEESAPKGDYWHCTSHPDISFAALERSRREFAPLIEALPFTVGMRGQQKGNYCVASYRAICQAPAVVSILERSWVDAMMPMLRKADCFAAFGGPESVDRAMTTMLQDPKGMIWSIDYQGFDSSVPPWLVNVAFDILWNVGIAEWKYANEFVFLKTHFLTADLLTPCGRLTGRFGSIPSGSGFTSLIGCVVNLLVMELAAQHFGFNVIRVQVCGDDGVWQLMPHGKHPMDPVVVMSWIYETFGMRLHPDKQHIDYDSAHFLQNIHRASWLRGGLNVGVRPIMRVLGGMLSYERFKPGWSAEMDTLRWIQQLEAARNHPCFPAFVVWFCAHDRLATKPVSQLIASAGGVEKVRGLLATGFHVGKTPVEMLASTLTARMIAEVAKGGDPWDIHLPL